MIRDVIDHQGATLDGQFVAINIGILLPDLKKADSPSSQRLLQLAKRFASRSEFNTFVQAFATTPSGTAAGGTLSW